MNRANGATSVILADAACAYKQPLFFRDVVQVWLRVSKLGNKSFAQEYQLVRESDGALVATGTSVSVAYNYKEERTIPLPQEWRDNITAYEPAFDV